MYATNQSSITVSVTLAHAHEMTATLASSVCAVVWLVSGVLVLVFVLNCQPPETQQGLL